MLEFGVGGDQDESRTGYQVMGFEDTIDARLRDKILSIIGEVAGHFAGWMGRMFQYSGADLFSNRPLNTLAVMTSSWVLVHQSVVSIGLGTFVPAVERNAWD